MKSNPGNKGQDTLYRTISGEIKPFRFDASVADVFADMIQRSVPGYEASLSIIRAVTAEYGRENSCLYDLGCSLGAATLAMRHGVSTGGCQIIAVDNSRAMVNRCCKLIERDASPVPVEVLEQNLEDTGISNASVVVMNYTLQFVPLEQRAAVLARIRQGMTPGGVLVLSEKIIDEDPEVNQRMEQLHARFKLQNGYDELEISQKRKALEHVLIPETRLAHVHRLEQAGFDSVVPCLQFLNFITLLARVAG